MLYELARQHKRIRGFRYDRVGEKGAGNDMYPLVWVDDPLTGFASSEGTVTYTVNVDILGIPKNDEDVRAVQTAAFDAGLAIYQRLKDTRVATQTTAGGYNFVTLRDYYDDNAAGVRFTYTLVAANPLNRCVEDFDTVKQFPARQDMPDFNTLHPDGCAIFSEKAGLPNFEV